MAFPLIFSFWSLVAAYVIHVIDESLLGGSFVQKVREHWWPEYTWTKFFWFNTAYFVVMIASVVAYDFLGGAWLILPPAWSIERTCNGFWHVWWAIHSESTLQDWSAASCSGCSFTSSCDMGGLPKCLRARFSYLPSSSGSCLPLFFSFTSRWSKAGICEGSEILPGKNSDMLHQIFEFPLNLPRLYSHLGNS